MSVSTGQRNYVLETGFYTSFSRCLLASLARLKAEHFDVPLAIETQIGQQEKTVFATVYNAANGKRINDDWTNAESDVDALFGRVKETLESRRAPAKPELAKAS